MIKEFVPIVVGSDGAFKPNSLACTDADEIFYEQIHLLCEGRMKMTTISSTSRAMFCPGCGFRVVFPRTVKTYGELREYLTSPQ